MRVFFTGDSYSRRFGERIADWRGARSTSPLFPLPSWINLVDTFDGDDYEDRDEVESGVDVVWEASNRGGSVADVGSVGDLRDVASLADDRVLAHRPRPAQAPRPWVSQPARTTPTGGRGRGRNGRQGSVNYDSADSSPSPGWSFERPRSRSSHSEPAWHGRWW